MKLNKYQNNNLLTHLIRQFLIQCSIITIVTLIVIGVLYVFAEWFIRQCWPDGYYYYRALYLAVAAVVVWTIQILVCTHRLLRRVVQYVDELQRQRNSFLIRMLRTLSFHRSFPKSLLK